MNNTRPANVAADGVTPACTVCDAELDLTYYFNTLEQNARTFEWHRDNVSPEYVVHVTCPECHANPERVRRLLAAMSHEELCRRLSGGVTEEVKAIEINDVPPEEEPNA